VCGKEFMRRPREMHRILQRLLQKMHQLLEEISFLLFARGGGGKAVARCILIGSSLPQSLASNLEFSGVCAGDFLPLQQPASQFV
jgi:hypothetical protein